MGKFNWKYTMLPALLTVVFSVVSVGCGSSSTGTGGSSSSTSTAVSGAVEVLQKHLSALGISSVGLKTVAPASVGLSSRVLSIPLEVVQTSTCTYSNLGTGADLGVKVDVGSDLKIPEAKVEIPGAAIATYTLQPKNSTKKLVMKSVVLQPETTGDKASITCGEASTGVILGIFGNADVKAAVSEATKVAPREVAALVAACVKLINANLPQLQDSSFIQDATTTLDSATGLPQSAAEEVATELGDKEEMQTNISVAKNIHAVRNLKEGSDTDKLGARKELARMFVNFVTDPRSAGPLIDALAKDTRKFTIGGLIPKLVAMEGKTVSVQAQSVADAINTQLKKMSEEFAKAKDQGFKRQESGPAPHEMMALVTYMKTITDGTLVVSATTEWDYLALPAVVGLIAGQIAPGTVDMMKTLAAHDIKFETAGFDMTKGDIFIGAHPKPVSLGSTLNNMKQDEALYVEVGGFGPDIRNAASAILTIGIGSGAIQKALSKVDLSGIKGRGPEVLFVASPDGILDEHWKHEFGSQPKAAAAVSILIDDALRALLDANSNLSLTALLKDSSGNKIIEKTHTLPIFVGGPGPGGQPPVDMTFTSPAMPAMGKPPELIPAGTTAIELIVSSTLVADRLPKVGASKLSADSIRYRFRIERMPAPTTSQPGGPPRTIGSEFERQTVWSSQLLKKPKVEAVVTLSNGIYGAHCEAVGVIEENGEEREFPVGFAMVPFMYGTADALFGDQGKFKDFLGSGDQGIKLDDIKRDFESTTALTVTVKVNNIPSGLTAPVYACVIFQPDFGKGEKTPTVKYAAKIDSTTKKATVTIPAADLGKLRYAWDIGIFVDKNSNGTWDAPTDFRDFGSGEIIMHARDKHPAVGRAGKLHYLSPGDVPTDSNAVTGDYAVEFEGPRDASAFQAPVVGPGFVPPGTN